jgi:hypothetical protein
MASTKKTFAASNMIEISEEKTLVAGGNYADEDILSEGTGTDGVAWNFANIASQVGRVIWLHKSIVTIETSDLVPVLSLHLFNITPTGTTADNVANNNPIAADKEEYQGIVVFPAMSNEGGISQAQVIHNPPIPLACAEGDTDIYGILSTGTSITNEAAGMKCLIKLMVREIIDV